MVIFCLGVFLTFSAMGKKSDAVTRIEDSERQLKQALLGSPAPSEENVSASKLNIKDLESELASIRADLQRGSRFSTSSDGVRVMSSIQKFITDYQNDVKNHTVAAVNGEPVPELIETPENFAFGFEKYIDGGQVPDDLTVVPVLDKQRQILSYILDQLIAANPKGIAAVKRELLENKKTSGKDESKGQGKGRKAANDKKSYQISPAVTARVPGAIDTMAFEVTFSGTTPVLREFLNRLKDFELPIVVRGVEVLRAEKTKVSSSSSRGGNNLNDIFDGFGGGSSTPAANTTDSQSPQTVVVDENDSTFTVILEFIEVVLPTEVNDSDPANPV